MNRINLILLLSTLTIFISCTKNTNWTQFRGSKLDGKAVNEKLALAWSPDSNIVWKTEIPGTGWSSPVIYENDIWLSTASDEGQKLLAIKVDKTSGEIQQELLLFEPDTVYSKHSVNSYATPTPCLEKDRAYFNFGCYGTACLNTSNNEVIW